MDREIAVARKRVQDTETAIMQEQEHMRNVAKARSTTTKPDTIVQEMLPAIRDSLSNLASSEDEEDGEDISKMYFSLWKTPGVSERMWSVNLEASISGEYQTLGGYSGRPSE